MEEKEFTWMPIDNYENSYAVSSLGMIKRTKYKTKICDKFLKVWTDRDGYSTVVLCKNGKLSNHKVHRIVANAFIPNPENKETVNHRDGNKMNNAVSNLEWATRSENTFHAIRTGLKPRTTPKQIAAVKKLTESNKKPIMQFSKDTLKYIKTYASATDASKELSIDLSNISSCCLGKTQSAGGFNWKYI